MLMETWFGKEGKRRIICCVPLKQKGNQWLLVNQQFHCGGELLLYFLLRNFCVILACGDL